VKMLSLDIGCGNQKVPGAIGIDKFKTQVVDVVCDLEKCPFLPFKDDIFDEIHAYHVLEHLEDTVKIMEEIWRVCKPKGKVFIRVPHYSGRKAWIDPTHKKSFSVFSFDYFGENENFRYYSSARFRVLKRRLKILMSYPNPKWYSKYIRPTNLPLTVKAIVYIIQLIVDRLPLSLCERLAFLVGGFDEVEIELEAIK